MVALGETREMQPSVRLDVRCDDRAAESVRRELAKLDAALSAGELSGLRAIVGVLVADPRPAAPSRASIELWAEDGAVHIQARLRPERITDEPPDLHPGAFALVERCAPRWAAQRTAGETVLRAELERRRLGRR